MRQTSYSIGKALESELWSLAVKIAGSPFRTRFTRRRGEHFIDYARRVHRSISAHAYIIGAGLCEAERLLALAESTISEDVTDVGKVGVTADFLEKVDLAIPTDRGPYAIVAQVGADVDRYHDVEMKVVLIGMRANEEAAIRERDRRNALKDGRSYFIMTRAEYEEVPTNAI